MAISTQYGNYVKFLRGTVAQWASMTPEDKNSDTLYFISDTGAATGKLYLGEKLISNGDLSSATSISDLNDVLISEGITDQSILVYDLESQKWVNKSILDVIQLISDEFTGATAEAAGTAGLVPAPQIGEQDYFLKGDGTWSPIEVVPPTEIEELETKINTLVGEDTGKSVATIAGEVADEKIALIVNNAPEAFDTLKEIADWIENHEETVDIVNVTNRVTDLEEILNGTPAGEDPEEQPAVPGLIANVNNLEDRVELLETDMATVKEVLKWQDISEVTA